jgi:hypothetical protein
MIYTHRYFDQGEGGAAGTPAAGTPQGDTTGTTGTTGADQAKQGGIMIPKERFDEVDKRYQAVLADQAKRDASDKKATDEQTKAKGEFEKLATQREQELNAANARFQAVSIRAAVVSAAAIANSVNPDVVAKLVDQSKLVVKDDGTVEGVKEAVDQLLKDNPYLIKPTAAGYSMGAGGTGSDLNTDQLAELSPAAYAQYRKDHPNI